MKKFTLASILAVAALGLGAAAPCYANFVGAYALPWTLTHGPGTLSNPTTVTNNPQTSFTFNGGDSVQGCLPPNDCIAEYSISVAGTGNIAFHWDFSSGIDSPLFEHFGFGLNHVLIELSVDAGGTNQSGNASIPVTAGDLFEFWYNCTDCTSGSGTATVSEFSGPVGTAPEPATLGLLGLGLAGLAASRRRKQ